MDRPRANHVYDAQERASAGSEPSAAQLAEITEAARLLIVEGLRLTPGGLIVREKADRSDPHYRLCTALEDAGLIPMSRRRAKAEVC